MEVRYIPNTTNVSCEEELLRGATTLNYETEEILRYFLTGFLVLTLPFTPIINIDVIILIVRSNILHQITFYLALQLVVVDQLTALFIYPIAITSAVEGEWVMGLQFCWVSAIVILLLRQARNRMMFVFVLDQFLIVFKPLKYPKIRGKFVIVASVYYCGSC